MAALALLIGARAAAGASWDERVFSSHVDFDAVAAAGASAIPDLIARGKVAVQGQVHHRGRGGAAEGDPGDRADQAQVRRQSRLRPHQRPGLQFLLRLPQRPRSRAAAGDFVTDAFVSEGFESAQFNSTDPSFSSERHTIALMGAGLVELLAREMTADLQGERADAVKQARASGQDVRADLVSKGVRFGSITAHPDGIVDLDSVEGVDADLIVRPFSRKGVFTSLRQFTINALNVHHGMEASERFGVRWTGSHDFDESGVPDAVTEGDVTALVAFQATLRAADRQERPARRLARRRRRRRASSSSRSAAPPAIGPSCR